MDLSERLAVVVPLAGEVFDRAESTARRLDARQAPPEVRQALDATIERLRAVLAAEIDPDAIEAATAEATRAIEIAMRPVPLTNSAPEEHVAPDSPFAPVETHAAATPPVAEPIETPAPGADREDGPVTDLRGAEVRAPVDYALAYAALGWPVLPVGADKKPHGGQGIKHASTEDAVIRQWWARWPDAGIGIHLGAVNLCAIDLDPRNGCTKAPSDFPATLTARTGGGGWHLIYRAPAGVALPGKLEPGVDIKHRGYIIVEPSLHPSGERYAWQDFEPIEMALVGAPDIAEFPLQLLPRATIEVSESGQGDLETAVTLAAATDETIAELASAFQAIPSDDRDLWVRLGHAVKPLGDRGLELWLAWSKKSAKFDADDAERVWESLEGERTDYRAVFAEAQRRGWSNPKAAPAPVTAEDFAVLPDAGKANRFLGEAVALFARRAAPEWIVRNVLPRAELGLVIGESGAGKSFLAFDLAAAIAQGVPWHGQKTKPGRVVYVASEGAAGMRQRATAYGKHHEVPLEALNLIIVSASPNLMQKQDVGELVTAIKLQAPVSAVIIDTLANAMPGGDENSFEDVSVVLAACKAIHRATGALVVVVHHLGKDSSKGARGHSSLKAAADVELTVKRSGTLRTAAVTKLKDGEEGAVYQFRLRVVDLGRDADGEPISSCVLQYVQSGEQAVSEKREPAGKNTKIVWRAVNDLVAFDDETTVGAVLDVAHKEIIHDPTKPRDRRRDLATQALATLKDEGWITVEGGAVRINKGKK